MAMHVDEKIGIKTYNGDDDGEAPSVAEGVAENRIFGTEPAPVPADRLICIQEKSNGAYHDVKTGLNHGRKVWAVLREAGEGCTCC